MTSLHVICGLGPPQSKILATSMFQSQLNLRVVKIKNASTVRYEITVRFVSIFAKRYGTLVRYVFFVMARVRYVGTVRFKIELKYVTLVRYGSRCEVRSMQILNVPYRTAILADNKILIMQV